MRGGTRTGAGRKPSPAGAKVMIPWRIDPRLIERIRWAAAVRGIQPATFLEQIIARNAPSV
jgi:hypothetical protein